MDSGKPEDQKKQQKEKKAGRSCFSEGKGSRCVFLQMGKGQHSGKILR